MLLTDFNDIRYSVERNYQQAEVRCSEGTARAALRIDKTRIYGCIKRPDIIDH